MRLDGKVALITGSTSGIGLGIARALAGAGAAVMLNGFADPAAVAALEGEFREKYKVKVAYSGADVSKPEAVREMIAEAEKTFGRLDVLVNNAGIQHVAPVEEFPPEKWDAILAINLSAAFHAIRAALPGMKSRQWGRIINIASAHGLVASPYKAAYVAAKHGLVGLTKVVAIEAAPFGVTVNAICPGWVLTPLVEKQLEDRAKQKGTTVEQEKIALLAETQPMHRFTSPEQIGALSLFLCSEEAATITGAPLSIDGGWVAH
jgi:3-hydroxybutyrate dehydrogenase